MNFINKGLFFTLLAVSTITFAEDGWKSAVEVGLISTTGNTETQSTNLKAAVEHEMQNWRNEVKIESLNVKGSKGRLSEKYLAGGKTSFKFNEEAFVFVTVDGEHNPFSGYAYQVSTSLGFGYRILNDKTTKLDFEGGPGYRETRLRGVTDAEGETVIRLNAKYVKNISKTAEFSEEITSAIGEDTTITKSVTALTAQIAGNLSMKMTFTFKNNSVAPKGFKNKDTETGLTLVYTF